MVKALHRAGLEVILDVVFNHTAEGDHRGPTPSFRGLDNTTYYILEGDRSRYANYSGTGNTLNGNHPIVRRMILDSLRYWVEAMHVDGFRFDLASILARAQSGEVVPNPPVLWDIESDPALAGTKLIAEAWDAAGLYQVGTFVGDSWKEWNGRFRDDVRSFFRGEEGSVERFADRLIGSPSLYGHKEREPEAERQLRDVPRRFHPRTTSSPTTASTTRRTARTTATARTTTGAGTAGWKARPDDPDIDKLRTRQVKNFLTVTMLSAGMPMLLMGDEVRRTQGGNNNAYCQDNETSWFDWTLLAKRADIHRFVTLLNARRVLRDVEHERQRVALNQLIRQSQITWHGVRLHEPDWRPCSHSVAFSARFPAEKALSRDPQRLLGAARVRPSVGRQRRPRSVAPMDRHVPRFSARYRRLGAGPLGSRSDLSHGAAFREALGTILDTTLRSISDFAAADRWPARSPHLHERESQPVGTWWRASGMAPVDSGFSGSVVAEVIVSAAHAQRWSGTRLWHACCRV